MQTKPAAPLPRAVVAPAAASGPKAQTRPAIASQAAAEPDRRWPAQPRALPGTSAEQAEARKQPGILVLVRHGQSQWNLENRFTGWTDVPLTAQGRAEAKLAGQQLLGLQFDKAYTSGLQRAQDTLTIILETIGQTNIPVVKSDKLNERHYGDLQGLNKAETAKKLGDEMVHQIRRSFDVRPPGARGESLKDTLERVKPYLRGEIMRDVLAGKRVIVAAHGNSLRAAIMDLEKLTPDEVIALGLETGVPIVYELDEAGNVLAKRVIGGEARLRDKAAA